VCVCIQMGYVVRERFGLSNFEITTYLLSRPIAYFQFPTVATVREIVAP